jgi:hypothetical protein
LLSHPGDRWWGNGRFDRWGRELEDMSFAGADIPQECGRELPG